MIISTLTPIGVYAEVEVSAADYSDYVAPEQRDDNLLVDNKNINFYHAINTRA